MLRVIYAECHYAEFGECRYAECRYIMCRGAANFVLKTFFYQKS